MVQSYEKKMTYRNLLRNKTPLFHTKVINTPERVSAALFITSVRGGCGMQTKRLYVIS